MQCLRGVPLSPLPKWLPPASEGRRGSGTPLGCGCWAGTASERLSRRCDVLIWQHMRTWKCFNRKEVPDMHTRVPGAQIPVRHLLLGIPWASSFAAAWGDYTLLSRSPRIKRDFHRVAQCLLRGR